MNKIALTAFLVAAVLSASKGYCQEVTARERSIYYEYLAQVGPYIDGPKEKYDEAEKRFAQSHQMSVDEVSSIVLKIYDAELTPQESRIMEEWSQMVMAAEEQGLIADTDEISEKIAAKYGISILMVEDIIERALIKGF